MTMFILFGFLFLVFGGLFILAPSVVILLSEWGNRLMFTDHGTVAHRKLTGMLLIATGLLMFYIGWTLHS